MIDLLEIFLHYGEIVMFADGVQVDKSFLGGKTINRILVNETIETDYKGK